MTAKAFPSFNSGHGLAERFSAYFYYYFNLLCDNIVVGANDFVNDIVEE
jgi:hypothetical protein